MRKIFLFLFVSLSFVHPSTAQNDTDINKKELHDLLDNRKKQFDAYSVSIEKHSGIFGNKTKNDVKKSQQVLIDIVKTDNRIISNLYRVVDFKTYEKVNINYDFQRNDVVLNNLRHAADTLSKQVEVLKSSNHILRIKSITLQWLFYLLCSMLIWMIIVLRKRNKNGKEASV